MDRPDSSLATTAARPAEPRFARLGRVLGYLFASACLVWVFHDIHLGRLFEYIGNLNWGWVALAVAFDILSYLCQALRWRLLLEPVGEISPLRATQAIYAGLFTNEILPMRFGELVRTYLVSRWLGANFASMIPSLAVERLLDGVWLAVGIGLTAIFVPLPKELLEAGDVFGVLVLIAAALFLYIVSRPQKEPAREPPRARLSWTPLRQLWSFIGGLSSGLRQIGRSRAFYLASGLSLVFLALQGLAFWLVMWAYGLRLSFWVGFVVFLVVHLGTAIPNAPANVGTYQFFTVVGLTLFGIEKTLATGFSVVVFVVLTVPLWGIGFLALTRSGTTLYELRSEISKLKMFRN